MKHTILAATGLAFAKAIGLSPVVAQGLPQQAVSQQPGVAKAVDFEDGSVMGVEHPLPIICESCWDRVEIPKEMAKLPDQLVLPPSFVAPPLKPPALHRNPMARLFSAIGHQF